jgi:hypothetical protein
VTAVLPYCLMLVRVTKSTWGPGLPADDGSGSVTMPPHARFHVRVLVPCYKVRGAV